MTTPNTLFGPLMVDIEGTTLSHEERQFLAHENIGGVILFTRNYASREQLIALVQEIQSTRKTPLLIAVDQEGGRIQRFRDEFTALPSPADFESHYLENVEHGLQLTRYAATLMATEIRQCGIDFSFAPLLDVSHHDSAVLHKRTFSSDIGRLVALAQAFIAGMHDAGMAATGKHFPGHGGVNADSHLETPVDTRSLDDIKQHDLVPFTNLSKHIDAVMTAHVAYPNVDAQLPTFSPFWLQKILRQDIAFDGVIFSDDLIMQGANIAGDIVTRTKLALHAGCDMALICNDPQAARKAAHAISHTDWVDATASIKRLQTMQGRPVQTQYTTHQLSDILAKHALI